MKILLHVCCAPCAIYPVKTMRQEGMQIMGYFYRHNIHPYQECLRRQKTLEAYAETIDLRVFYQEDYDVEGFLRKVIFRENQRCQVCYHERLASTALFAKRGKFDGFSTTLLYSKFQQHDAVKSIGQAVSQALEIPFIYQDFREGWKSGIAESKQLGLYRQSYCGCIYSEKERFYKP